MLNMVPLIAEAVKPTGVWETILFAFGGGMNFVWGVLIFCIVLQLVMYPLDFFNRRMMKKNSEGQKILQPKLQEVKEKYPVIMAPGQRYFDTAKQKWIQKPAFDKNKQIRDQKIREVYTKSDVKLGGPMFVSLIAMVLNMVIFITLFGGLNSIARYRANDQYLQARSAYELVMDVDSGGSGDESEALEAAKVAYLEKRESWAWVHNIWMPDNWSGSVMSFDAYKSRVGLEGQIKKNYSYYSRAAKPEERTADYDPVNFTTVTEGKTIFYNNDDMTEEGAKTGKTRYNEAVTADLAAEKALYEKLIGPIADENSGWNGILLLPILVVGVNIFSQLVTMGFIFKKKKDKEKPKGLVMMLVLNGIFVYFALVYNAVFSIYMITGAVMRLAFFPLNNFIIGKMDAKKAAKTERAKPAQPDYKRPAVELKKIDEKAPDSPKIKQQKVNFKMKKK